MTSTRTAALTGLIALALALTVGSGTVRAAPPTGFIGAERCGACHEAEYAQWKTTGHAESLARLSEVQAKDPVCRSCHTMEPSSDDPTLAGVQCESCHGAGRYYAPRHIMKDPELRRLVGLTPVEATVCAPCHTADAPGITPFDFHAMLARVRHDAGPPPKEPTADGPGRSPAHRAEGDTAGIDATRRRLVMRKWP